MAAEHEDRNKVAAAQFEEQQRPLGRSREAKTMGAAPGPLPCLLLTLHSIHVCALLAMPCLLLTLMIGPNLGANQTVVI